MWIRNYTKQPSNPTLCGSLLQDLFVGMFVCVLTQPIVSESANWKPL